LWLLVLLQLGIFAGIGHISPNATAQALAQQGARAGAASALLGSIQSIGSTLAGFLTGVFSKGGVHAMALLMLLGSVLLLVVHRWLDQRRLNNG
jgi:DHA1 family bicyclomycin/chloramphenicol resistance-like MFS transporter